MSPTDRVPDWFRRLAPLRTLVGYLKHPMRPVNPDGVRCRGDARAAGRRQARSLTARWPQANLAAEPFRMKKVAKIEEERRARLGAR